MKARKMPFDTLAFANRMKAAGMESKLAEEQAEAIADALYDGLEAKIDNLVTKDTLKAELIELKLGLKLEMEQIEKRLAKLLLAGLSAVTIILGLLQHFHW